MSELANARPRAAIHTEAELAVALTEGDERLHRMVAVFSQPASQVAVYEGSDIARDCHPDYRSPYEASPTAERHAGALLRHLFDPRWGVRLIAIHALREIARQHPRRLECGYHPIAERLGHALYDTASLVRCAAAGALGDQLLCTAYTQSRLASLLWDPRETDQDVQRAALRASGESLWAREHDDLLEAMSAQLSSRHPELAVEASRALALHGHQPGAEGLVRILHEHDEGTVMLEALAAIAAISDRLRRDGRLGREAAASAGTVVEGAGLRLIELLGSLDHSVSREAGWVVRSIPADTLSRLRPEPGHAEILLEVLAPDSLAADSVRGAAAHLVAASEGVRRALDGRADARLMATFKDPHSHDLRSCAAEALLTLGKTEMLRHAASDYDDVSQHAAATALSKWRGMAALAAPVRHERSR